MLKTPKPWSQNVLNILCILLLGQKCWKQSFSLLLISQKRGPRPCSPAQLSQTTLSIYTLQWLEICLDNYWNSFLDLHLCSTHYLLCHHLGPRENLEPSTFPETSKEWKCSKWNNVLVFYMLVGINRPDIS